MTPSIVPNQRGGSDDRGRLRHLANRGRLAASTGAERRALYRAAYDLAYPIVFDVVTRRVARNRGHLDCSRELHQLEESCPDGFHADVEAVVEYLLATANPIRDLEGWLAGRAVNATIDGNRRRRGARGALQRPRMTRALAEALPADSWLHELALRILVWVGVPAGAGATLWPLEAWAGDRAAHTGDYRGSTTMRVAEEVEQVLTVMRRRPAWFAEHVERPLGLKTAPVAGSPGERPGEPRPMVTDPAERDEARTGALAGLAVEAIRAGLHRGEDPAGTVIHVLTTLFLGGTGADEIDRVPGDGPGRDERMSVLLADPAALSVLVQRVLDVVREAAE